MDERPSGRDDNASDHRAPDDATAETDDSLEAFYGKDDIFGLNLTPRPEAAPRVPPKKARTATGALLTGIALGLRDVFDPEKKRDTIAIEQEAPGEPEGPQRYEIRLNSSPRDGQAIYRPWVDDEDPDRE
jgi:hypothetical protein